MQGPARHPGREEATYGDPAALSGPVGIVTDSVACVPAELARQLGIEVVPIWIHMGPQSLRDGVDITPREVYRRLRQGHEAGLAVSTSAPSPGDFLEAFQRLAGRGARAVVAVTLPAELSAAYRSACLAARESPVPARVVDCRTAAAAQGWVAVEAARAAARGGQVEEVLARIEEVRRNCRAYAMVPDLRYLRRGGRVVHALARIGAALGVVPVLGIHPEARIEPVALASNRQAALRRILDELRAESARGRLHVAVMEADAAEEAQRLAERVREELRPAELWITAFSPAMGIHAGPGVVGVGYWVEEG